MLGLCSLQLWIHSIAKPTIKAKAVLIFWNMVLAKSDTFHAYLPPLKRLKLVKVEAQMCSYTPACRNKLRPQESGQETVSQIWAPQNTYPRISE